MMRLWTIFFCLLLAAAAAGRYQAEASVRAYKSEIRSLEAEIEAEEKKIDKLVLEVEVLESGKRITQLAKRHLDLKPVSPEQLKTAEQFAAILALPADDLGKEPVSFNDDFIVDALAMAEFATPAGAVEER